MSYTSRVYRQRNANTHDESKQKAFFSEKDEKDKANAQEKVSAKTEEGMEQEADDVAKSVNKKPIDVQRLATSQEDEKASTNDERMKADKDIQEKPMQLKEDSTEGKDEEKVQKKNDQKEEDKTLTNQKVQKADETKKESEEKDQASVQPKRNDDAVSSPQPSMRYLNETKGKGEPLPKATLMEMNTKFEYDFSNVRIHRDAEAARVSQELQAHAFTHGTDIYFNEGKFDPSTSDGKLLLAHELTHVVQQTNSDQVD